MKTIIIATLLTLGCILNNVAVDAAAAAAAAVFSKPNVLYDSWPRCGSPYLLLDVPLILRQFRDGHQGTHDHRNVSSDAATATRCRKRFDESREKHQPVKVVTARPWSQS